MRTFITLEFDNDTKKKIADVQSIIKQNSESGRFKYIDNFHITLKFLGEIDSNKLKSICDELVENLKDEKTFSLILNGLGAFGSGEIIKTIYIKTEGEVSKLAHLAKIVDSAAVKHGLKPERSYTPHVTIAQEVKLNKSFDELQREINSGIFEEILFDRVVIMKSEQIGKKRVYTPIKTINLSIK
jgi:2'-5' RNA ligase